MPNCYYQSCRRLCLEALEDRRLLWHAEMEQVSTQVVNELDIFTIDKFYSQLGYAGVHLTSEVSPNETSTTHSFIELSWTLFLVADQPSEVGTAAYFSYREAISNDIRVSCLTPDPGFAGSATANVLSHAISISANPSREEYVSDELIVIPTAIGSSVTVVFRAEVEMERSPACFQGWASANASMIDATWGTSRPDPDIQLTDATTTDFQNFEVKYSISDAEASDFLIRAYISEDDKFDRGVDQELPQDSVLSITDYTDRRPNRNGTAKMYTKTLSLSDRASIDESHRFVIIVADADNQVLESNPDNNGTFAVPLFALGEKMNRPGDKGMNVAETNEQTASGPFTRKILPGSTDFNRLQWLDQNFDFNPPHTGPWPFEFLLQTEATPELRLEDRLGQASLLQPLQRLVSLFAQDGNKWTNAHFSINEAYDSTGVHEPDSLHYEGRAIDFQVFSRDQIGDLGRFAGLAWLAGFDWVWYEPKKEGENNHHVHVSMRESIRNAPPGDTNADGKTDLQDLNNIRNDFGSSGPHLVADTDGNASVGLEDLNAVRNNFGAMSSALTVSEPSIEVERRTAKDDGGNQFIFERHSGDVAAFSAAVDRVHEVQAVVWQRWQVASGNSGSTDDGIFKALRRPRRPSNK